jgi:hypothetical protein
VLLGWWCSNGSSGGSDSPEVGDCDCDVIVAREGGGRSSSGNSSSDSSVKVI